MEELEDRFGTQMDDILETVKSSLSVPAGSFTNGVQGSAGAGAEADVVYAEDMEMQEYVEEDGTWEYDANEVVFDDAGEGAGVEGDLDIEDD